MTNPLIQKFEEVYGKKPREGGIIDQLTSEPSNTLIVGSSGVDTISFNDSMLSSITCPSGMGSPYVSSSMSLSQNFTITLPNTTETDKQFCKILKDIAEGKAVVTQLASNIDSSYVGIGAKITYSIDITSKYP